MSSQAEKTEQQPPLNADVVIVGAGLVGSAMACSLAAEDEGLRIVVIEPGAEPLCYQGEEFDPRVVALTRSSQELLESVGVWDEILAERACPYTDMDVWDAAGTGQIHFDCREVQQLNLGHIVENSVVTRALLKRMSGFANITLLQPALVSDRVVEHGSSRLLLKDGREVSAPLVIAADGANSKLRQLAGIETREWDYGHHAIVTTVRTEKPHQHTAWQRFLDTGPLAFLPMQLELADGVDSHYSSIVWSIEPEQANQLMALDDEQFMLRLSEAFEYRLGAVTGAAQRFSFPLRQRHALHYAEDGLALIGDAAHTIHPLAGQGVNLGFLDAAALATEVLRARRRQLPLSEPSILKRYQRNRKSHNLGMMSLMEGFKRLFSANDLPIRWVRNEGMRRLNSVSILKNAVAKQAMGL